MKIKKDIYTTIINQFTDRKQEQGGIIGADDGVICAFHMDDTQKKSASEYIPNVKELNKVLLEWNRKNIGFIGFIHSHVNGLAFPSPGDEIYAETIKKRYPNIILLFPIVTFIPTTAITFFEYDDQQKFKKIMVDILLD